jgi:PAS domain S-box-containing protein
MAPQTNKDLINDLKNKIKSNNQSFEALNREKLFSEKVLDSLPGIFYLYDENANLIRWNKNHETLTGYNASELSKRKMLEWFSGDDQILIAETAGKVFEEGKKLSVDAYLIIKNNKKIPYFFTAVRMTLEGKRYLLGMGTDLTEIKKIENELLKSEQKYKAIFQNAVEGIYQSTVSGKFIDANPAMANLLGWDSIEDLKLHVKDIKKQIYVSYKDRQEFIRQLKTNQKVAGFETQFYRKDGTKTWVSIFATLIQGDDETQKHIEGIVTDINEQKRITKELLEREASLKKENIRLRSNLKDRYKFCDIIGKSAIMQKVYETIIKASATDANVIIYGDSGTGKELVAQAIHQLSDRKDRAFVPVHCGAIPENLLESELFGYKKGAFTGADIDKKGFLEIAEGGTLFLDELGEISLNIQIKLLRVLEGKAYTPVGSTKAHNTNIRIVAATNKNLKQQVTLGLMREDLYYRIHIIPLYMPPLKDRREDIPLLIEHFIKLYAKDDSPPKLTGKNLEALLNYDWPGNVRELQNVLQRFTTLDTIVLPNQGAEPDKGMIPTKEKTTTKGRNYQILISEFEKSLFLASLENHRWHRQKAAASLGLPLRTFYRKMKSLGITRQQ